MTTARARVVLFALLAVGALGYLAPASAGAFVSYYNCTAKPSGQWCDGRANLSFDGLHSWDYNQGWGGAFQVCQRVWKPSTGGVLAGSNCGTGYAAFYYGAVQCACYEAEVLQNSGAAQNINGFADADF
jgi:hypothetical protein